MKKSTFIKVTQTVNNEKVMVVNNKGTVKSVMV